MVEAVAALALQVFTFVGHDCPAGFTRLIPVPPVPAAPAAPSSALEITPSTWHDFIINIDGKAIELVWCVKSKTGGSAK